MYYAWCYALVWVVRLEMRATFCVVRPGNQDTPWYMCTPTYAWYACYASFSHTLDFDVLARQCFCNYRSKYKILSHEKD